MTSVAPAPADGPTVTRGWERSADRRHGIASLLAALAAHVGAGRDQFTLRAEFERRLRDLLQVTGVRLREESASYGAPGSPPAPEPAGAPLCLDVPTRQKGARVLLEARCVPGTLDEWSLQLLGMAAHLAALLVDVGQRALPRERPAHRGPESVAPPLVGNSPVMRALRERIARVAVTDFTVLVEGESGTGKELVARQVHALSPRRFGPFVAVNCAAIVDTLLEAELFGIEERTATGVRGRRGKFELADGGTLFLDEVADLAPAAQAKLLRAIQELSVERVGGHLSRRVDTRIVVATNRSLRDLVTRGVFREDLFYRLSGVELHVPPLRCRREDILPLATHFLLRHPRVPPLVLSPEAEQALTTYGWPGNVRELERALEGAATAAQGSVIAHDDLPASVRHDFAAVLWPSLAQGDTMRAWGCRYARLVLQRCAGNKRRACDILDISYHTLQSYLRDKPWESLAAEAAPGEDDERPAVSSQDLQPATAAPGCEALPAP